MKKGVLLPILTIVLAAAVLFGAAFGLSGVTKANARKDHIRLLQTLLPAALNSLQSPTPVRMPTSAPSTRAKAASSLRLSAMATPATLPCWWA